MCRLWITNSWPVYSESGTRLRVACILFEVRRLQTIFRWKLHVFCKGWQDILSKWLHQVSIKIYHKIIYIYSIFPLLKSKFYLIFCKKLLIISPFWITFIIHRLIDLRYIIILGIDFIIIFDVHDLKTLHFKNVINK